MNTETPNASRHRRRTSRRSSAANRNSPIEPMTAQMVWRAK